MMRNQVYFRLFALLVVFLTGWNVAAAYDFEEGGIYYNVNEDGASVTVTFETTNYNSYSGDVVIPNFVTHNGTTYTVTAIGRNAFNNCTDLTSIVISDSVKTVGGYAFRICTGLRNVTIGKSVTSLKNAVFSGCDGVTSLTWNAVNCADNGNMGTTNIEQVTIGPEVQTIPANFAKGSQITEITIPNSVLYIENGAFSGCGNMSEVTMGNSVKTIGERVFSDCVGIEEITIPNTVTQIGADAFYGCQNLSKVNISSIEAWCGIIFGDKYDKFEEKCESNPLYFAHHLYLNGQEFKDLVIPNTITAINDYAFCGGIGLTSVTLGDSVISIGNYAFKECSGLTNVTLGSGLTAIGSDAFRGCSSLTSFTLGKSVTQIGSGELNNILASCSDLTSIAVESGNPVYDSRDNCNAIIETATNTLIVGCQSTVIPNSVTCIALYAFYGCDSLTSIVIPKSVTSIVFETEIHVGSSCYGFASNPFGACNGLKSITVENGNPVYDSRGNCNAIVETATNTLIVGCQSTIIPNTITAIGEYAFNHCKTLKQIDVPNSVTTINNEAFLGAGLTSVTIPNSVTSIGDGAFAGCQSLISIDISNSVTEIGLCAFRYCTSLTSVVIPNSVVVTNVYEKQSHSWFWGCTNLTKVTLGSGIVEMAAMFWECPNITSVTCLAATPPGLVTFQRTNSDGKRVYIYNFDDVIYSQAILYVPVGSLETYQTKYGWKNFQDIRPLGDADGDGTVGIADVTELIDYLLAGSGSGLDMGAADVDGDGTVSIADVTELIDTLLNQ